MPSRVGFLYGTLKKQQQKICSEEAQTIEMNIKTLAQNSQMEMEVCF